MNCKTGGYEKEKKALSKSICVVLSATLLPISSGAVIAGEIAQKKVAKANDLASIAASDKDNGFSINCVEKSEDSITVSWSDILSSDEGSYSVYSEIDGEECFDNTDADGSVRLIAPIGEHKVSFYKNGYLPISEMINFTNGGTNSIVSIEKGELITGDLVAKPMDLGAIEAEGIDTTDPDNQYVYSFNVNVKSDDVHDKSKFRIIVNEDGEIINADSTFEYLGENIVKINTGDSGNSGGGACYCGFIPSNTPGEAPSVVSLYVSTTFTWLKEFFDVSLKVNNNASHDFSMYDSKAELTLPKGLSLANTGSNNSAVRSMGTIYGGSSAEERWYVRGDTKGEYDLFADFSAMLSPFNTEVTKKFKTDEKIKVIGGEALKLIVKQEYQDVGSGVWHVDFELKNDSDITIYNPTINYSGYSEFMYCTSMYLRYPDGTTKIISWNNGSEEKPSEEEFLPAFIKKDSSEITKLEPGEKITGYYSAYRKSTAY